MQLLVCLKSRCSGKMQIDGQELRSIANEMEVTTRTVRNNLKRLITLNWIGFNRASGWYHIRGFQKILRSFSEAPARQYEPFDLRHIAHMKEYIVAQSIGNLINYQIKKQKSERRKSADCKTSIQSNQTEDMKRGYFPIANNALAKCWGKSKSHAFKMKRLAYKAKYIDIERRYEETGMDWWHLHHYIKAGVRNATVLDGKVVINLIDLVKHELHFKTRRKPFTVHK